MGLLSEKTRATLETAAFEVLVRGVGANKEWNYTLRDCLLVGTALDRPDPLRFLRDNIASPQAERLLALMQNKPSPPREPVGKARKRGW